RLRIAADPEFTDAALIETVEADLKAARSDDEDLNCRIDLQLGEFLLAAALAGRRDGAALADRALAALDRATTRNAPALRTLAIRALGDAYQRRSSVLRKAREAAKSAKTK